MFLGGESKVLSIENKVSAITHIKTFMLKLENRGAKLFVESIYGMLHPPPKSIYLACYSTPHGSILLEL